VEASFMMNCLGSVAKRVFYAIAGAAGGSRCFGGFTHGRAGTLYLPVLPTNKFLSRNLRRHRKLPCPISPPNAWHSEDATMLANSRTVMRLGRISAFSLTQATSLSRATQKKMDSTVARDDDTVALTNTSSLKKFIPVRSLPFTRSNVSDVAPSSGGSRPVRPPPPPPPPRVSATVQRSMDVLNKLTSYACTDALTFTAKEHPLYAGIAGRLAEFNQDETRQRANGQANMASNMAALAAKNGTLSLDTLDRIAQHVHNAQAGCCTTMAYAATAEMLKNNHENERVEIVSRRGHRGHQSSHCVVVVGRAEDSELSNPSTWGAKAIVIDPWKASLGGALQGTPFQPPEPNIWPPTISLLDVKPTSSK